MDLEGWLWAAAGPAEEARLSGGGGPLVGGVGGGASRG
jgi:hypothetical protein